MTYVSTAFQLTHLLQRVYDKLEQTKGLLATGGSATTVVDSAISADVEDDAYNGYTAFVAYDAGGAGVSPEGKYRRVTDYVASNTTLTLDATVTDAIAAGDLITIANGSKFPLNDVIRLCNNALRKLGRVPSLDVSLTTAANQTEYNLPATVQWDEIVLVELQGNTADANDNRYVEIPRGSYKIVPPSVPGGTAVLVLPQYSSGYIVRLTSIGEHPVIQDYDDYISKAIPPTLAVSACALEIARWKRNAIDKELMKSLEMDYEIALLRHPVTKFIRQTGGMPHWSNSVTDTVPSPINYGV